MNTEPEEPTAPEYTKGFNEGYIIGQHLPALAEKLAGLAIDSARHNGFVDGKNQLELERERDDHPSWLNADRSSDRTKDLENDTNKTKNRDRDNLERD